MRFAILSTDGTLRPRCLPSRAPTLSISSPHQQQLLTSTGWKGQGTDEEGKSCYIHPKTRIVIFFAVNVDCRLPAIHVSSVAVINELTATNQHTNERDRT